ncbi:unnamed protein product, partial [marine sediment metagenome]
IMVHPVVDYANLILRYVQILDQVALSALRYSYYLACPFDIPFIKVKQYSLNNGFPVEIKAASRQVMYRDYKRLIKKESIPSKVLVWQMDDITFTSDRPCQLVSPYQGEIPPGGNFLDIQSLSEFLAVPVHAILLGGHN